MKNFPHGVQHSLEWDGQRWVVILKNCACLEEKAKTPLTLVPCRRTHLFYVLLVIWILLLHLPLSLLPTSYVLLSLHNTNSQTKELHNHFRSKIKTGCSGGLGYYTLHSVRACAYIPHPLFPPGTGHPVCLPVDLGFQPSEHTHKHKLRSSFFFNLDPQISSLPWMSPVSSIMPPQPLIFFLGQPSSLPLL